MKEKRMEMTALKSGRHSCYKQEAASKWRFASGLNVTCRRENYVNYCLCRGGAFDVETKLTELLQRVMASVFVATNNMLKSTAFTAFSHSSSHNHSPLPWSRLQLTGCVWHANRISTCSGALQEGASDDLKYLCSWSSWLLPESFPSPIR